MLERSPLSETGRPEPRGSLSSGEQAATSSSSLRRPTSQVLGAPGWFAGLASRLQRPVSLRPSTVSHESPRRKGDGKLGSWRGHRQPLRQRRARHGCSPPVLPDTSGGRLDRGTRRIVRGAEERAASRCALIGGETAEMPGLYDREIRDRRRVRWRLRTRRGISGEAVQRAKPCRLGRAVAHQRLQVRARCSRTSGISIRRFLRAWRTSVRLSRATRAKCGRSKPYAVRSSAGNGARDRGRTRGNFRLDRGVRGGSMRARGRGGVFGSSGSRGSGTEDEMAGYSTRRRLLRRRPRKRGKGLERCMGRATCLGHRRGSSTTE